MTLDLNDLNGPQRKIVREALLAAFDEAALDRLLDEELNKPPLRNLVPAGSFEDMAFQLVRRSRQEGWTGTLIEVAESHSGNPRIKTLRTTLEHSQTLGLAALNASVAKPGGLERLVRDGGFADWGLWVDRMAHIGRQICRVEYPAGLAMGGGTGFLVGPDLVLTNYHVVEPFISGTSTLNPASIRCRFDFTAGSGGTGKAEPLVAAPGWLVDHSPYSPHDPGDQGGLPQPDQLDYALLRLAARAGDDPVDDGGARGWSTLNPDAAPPAAGDILFIGQHPELDPLKLAVGAVQQLNANGTRVRYDANTEKGSSGSPCLSAGLELVALHHGGDPDYTKLRGDFNQGIPIGLIARRIQSRDGRGG